MPPSVSTGNRDAVLRRTVFGFAAVQTAVNCHCEVEKYSLRNVKPVKFPTDPLLILDLIASASISVYLNICGDDMPSTHVQSHLKFSHV